MNNLLSKRNVVSIISVVIAFIFGFFIGDASAVNRIKKQISANVTNSSSNTSSSKESKKEKKGLTLTDLGQEASLDQFTFKITSIENSKEAKTPSKSIHITSNNYVVVRLQYTSKRTAPAQLNNFNLTLANTKDNSTYNLNSDVSIDMNSTLKYIDHQDKINYLSDNVNPNLPAEVVLIFETPVQADNNFALIISGKDNKESVGLKLLN